MGRELLAVLLPYVGGSTLQGFQPGRFRGRRVSNREHALHGDAPAPNAVLPLACRRMTVSERADVVVVGLGAMGSAVSAQLATRGTSVIGIDQYHPRTRTDPHTATRG